MTTANDFDQSWVATGAHGTVGSILRSGDNFSVRIIGDDALRGPYDSLDAAKNAIHAAMGPGSDRPEFTEH